MCGAIGNETRAEPSNEGMIPNVEKYNYGIVDEKKKTTLDDSNRNTIRDDINGFMAAFDKESASERR